MSYEPPTPPANLPTEIVSTLNESSPGRLRDVAHYAEHLLDRTITLCTDCKQFNGSNGTD